MNVNDGASQEIREFVVPNELGLHARAATRLAKTTSAFGASVEIRCGDNRKANARSVLDLLTLGAEQGQTLSVTTDGADAAEAMAAIAELFGNNLGD